MQIALGTKSKKKTPKATSVIKEDRQVFGVILGDEIDLSEALKYPITSIPLGIGSPDGTLRQSPKNIFWNFLIYQSSAMETQPPFQARWIIDTMTIMRSVKSKKTYALIEIVNPNKHWNPLNLFLTHTVQLVEKVVRAQKEENLVSWAAFFQNIKNKQNLSNLFANFIRKSYSRDINDVSVVIANNMETLLLTDQYVEKLFESNHEEADIRMVLHALYKNTNTVYMYA